MNEVEDRLMEITDTKQNKDKRMKRNEDSLRELQDIKRTNNSHYRGSRRRSQRKGQRKIFEEIIAENFPNMGKESLTQIQEERQVSYRINPRRNTLRHILIKLIKINDKQRNLESSQGKETNNIQGNPDKVISRFFNRNSAGQKGVA